MPDTTEPKQATQNLIATLLEATKRLARVEAKLTQLMLHQGMQSDGRQRIDHRALHA